MAEAEHDPVRGGIRYALVRMGLAERAGARVPCPVRSARPHTPPRRAGPIDAQGDDGERAATPTSGPRRRGPLVAVGALLFFVVATLLLTWPLAVASGRAVSLADDYFSNTWNIWWTASTLLGDGGSLYACDALFAPRGVSLVGHTLSVLNAAAGAALLPWLGLNDAYRVLLLAHFLLGGWCFFLFVRELTGSAVGALLGGLVWSFGPLHVYYVAQMNLATIEFLPLAALFMVRVHRRGGVANALGLALAAVLLVTTNEFYLVYAAGLGLLLLVGGRLWDPEAPPGGAPRLVRAAALAGLAVLPFAWPTLGRVLGGGAFGGNQAEGVAATAEAANDLLGFYWMASPDLAIVSWPTMLGYVAIVIVLLGGLPDRRRLFWLALGLLFLVLSLGSTLTIGREETGVTLPYAVFDDVPVLGLLRKPNRFLLLTLLAHGVLCGYGWQAFSRRLDGAGQRLAFAVGAVVLVALELGPFPMPTFELGHPAYYDELAERDDVEAIAEIPPVLQDRFDARANYYQTVHGKHLPLGYVTSLALTDDHWEDARRWGRAHNRLRQGDAAPLLELLEAGDVDALVLHERPLIDRRYLPGYRPLDEDVVWAPFVAARSRLMTARQRGPLVFGVVPRREMRAQVEALVPALGAPVHEDEEVIVFRR